MCLEKQVEIVCAYIFLELRFFYGRDLIIKKQNIYLFSESDEFKLM